MDLEQAKRLMRDKVPEFAHKVAPIYALLKWEWADRKTRELYIPREAQLAKELLDLIDGLTLPYTAHGTGGLEVYYEPPTDEDSGHFGMRFTLKDDTSFEQ